MQEVRGSIPRSVHKSVVPRPGIVWIDAYDLNWSQTFVAGFLATWPISSVCATMFNMYVLNKEYLLIYIYETKTQISCTHLSVQLTLDPKFYV